MKSTIICLCFLICASPWAAESTSVLPVTEAQLTKKNAAKVTYDASGIRMEFDDPSWDSGVSIKPPAGARYWDLSKWTYLAADIQNLSPDKQLRLTMHIYAKRPDSNRNQELNTGIALNPGEKRTMRMVIPHISVYSTPKGVPGPRTIDSAHINSIDFHMQWPFEGSTKDLVDCRISNLRLEKPLAAKEPISNEKFFPFIDHYGQFVHGDWAEKIKTSAQLKAKHAKELEQLATLEKPASWNRFGGWKDGPKLKATGHFRVAKYKGKWYFVDPDGRLFFSHGLDVLYAHTDATKTKDHAKWFMTPSLDSDSLAFTDTNLKLKYGKEDYASDFYDTLVKRLGCWGFNSIGDWGNAALMAKGKVPYTLQITDYSWSMPRISGSKLKFYDVFDDRYIRNMKNLIPAAIDKNPILKRSLTDPLCIGYFIDNELDFGVRHRHQLIKDVMGSPAKQAMKQEFVKDLKLKYQTIDKLSAAWKTYYQSWDDLLSSTSMPSETEGFRIDADAFTQKAVEQYFRLCRDAIKSVAPHRLYLGCRFISTDATRKILYDASKKYCDVLTTNVYAHSTANLMTSDFPDMPVLIGEFHFGVFDRGMFAPGLCPAGITQQDRALAYVRFVQGALVHPNIVGTHWFQFRDQPLTGRWDGEGYAIGFVDVADTPYEQMTRAAREIGRYMYQYRMNGKLKNSLR